MKTCLNCKREITSNKNKFCNRSCAASFNNKLKPSRIKPEQISNCLQCNEIIIRKPSQILKGHKVYCSNTCAHTHRTNIQQDVRSNKFNEGRLSNRSQLRKLVIERDGLICSCCKLITWLDKPIPLWLDHIDGNASNNNPQNLRMICLNCDALGDTFGNKNRGKGRRSLGLKPWQ